MHPFVTKLLREEHRNSFDFYNSILLDCKQHEGESEKPGSAPTFHTGCLFVIRCQLRHESPRSGGSRDDAKSSPATLLPLHEAAVREKSFLSAPPSHTDEQKAARFGQFDLDRDEPAFMPPSPNGSFSSASASASLRSDTKSHPHGGALLPERGWPSSKESAQPTRTFRAPGNASADLEGGRRMRLHADPLAIAGMEATATTTKDFIVWTSHAFLREHLPLLFQRLDGRPGSPASPMKGSRNSTEGFARSRSENPECNASSRVFGSEPVSHVTISGGVSSPVGGDFALSCPPPADGDGHVVCVRAVDVLQAEVGTHHVTARDRRIHAVTLSVRDYHVGKSVPRDEGSQMVCRVVRHRFVFQNGGMTRFLSTVKALAPNLVCSGLSDAVAGENNQRKPVSIGGSPSPAAAPPAPWEDARPSSGPLGKGQLEVSFGFSTGSAFSSPRHASPTRTAVPSPAAATATVSGGAAAGVASALSKRWRTRWPTSFFGLRRGDGGAFSGSEMGHSEDHTQEMLGYGTSTLQPLHRGGASPSSSARDDGSKEERSSESSFTDLTELEGSRSLIPVLRFPAEAGAATSRARLAQGGGRQTGAFTPLSEEEWRACFDGEEEVLNYRLFDRAREAVYRCGIASTAANIRFEVWMYLLDIFTPSSTRADREHLLMANKTLYDVLTLQWTSMLPEQIANFRGFKDRKHAIEKDVSRTDRNLAVYKSDSSPHLQALLRILMAHVQYNFDAGYSQGMSDVASVAVVLVHLGPRIIMEWTAKVAGGERASSPCPFEAGEPQSDQEEDGGDDGVLTLRDATRSVKPAPSVMEQLGESAAFLCFRAIIRKHMAMNFSMDPLKGMPLLLRQVQVLVRHFAPDVYAHLKICMSDDMTFCLRWLLMCFKRECSTMEDAMRLWDTIFGCPFTLHFEVIVCVALLVRTGTQIMAALHSCGAVLKFANNLAGNVRVEDVLRCAVDFYDGTFAVEVARLESILQGAYVPPRQPAVEEAVKLCIIVDGDVANR